MLISEVKAGDELVIVTASREIVLRVVKVNRATIVVENEAGEQVKAYPGMFTKKKLQ